MIESGVVKSIESVAREMGSPMFTSDKSKHVRGTVFFLILCGLMTESFLSIVNDWSDLNSRFQAIEDFVVLLYACCVMYELRASPEYLQTKLFVMAGNIDGFNKIENVATIGNIDKYKEHEIENEELEKRKKIFTNQESIKKWFITIVIMFSIINGILPISLSITYLSTSSDEITKHDLFIPFECWLPFPINNIRVYVVIAVVQMVGMLVFSCSAFCWFTSTVCSLLAIGNEIDILCDSIKDIDVKVTSQNANRNIIYFENKVYQDQHENNLKTYFLKLVQRHQAIIRAVKMLNESLSWSMLLFNQVCCVQFCISLYGFIEREDQSSKVKYLLLLVPVFWCFTLFCSYGQQLINKSENLNSAIYHCSWTEKPDWFKKGICFMLRRAQQPLQIRPLQLYTLNFNNMMTVLRAAYSYFNLMHTLNTK